MSPAWMKRRGVVVPRVVATEDVEPFFADNLEGGQYNDANGFQWGPQALVTVEEAPAGGNSGTHAFCFTYGPDAPDTNGAQAAAELRFLMGRDLTQVAKEFLWYVPENYTHRLNANPLTENNKFLGMWRDTVNNMNNWRFVLETNPDNFVTGGPNSVARASASSGTGNLEDQVLEQSQFIDPSGPVVKGTWTRIRVFAKVASSPSANDGVLQWWAGNTLICNVQNGNFWNQNDTYPSPLLNMGYLMGSSNAGFTEQTKFYAKGFKFFDQKPGSWP